VTQPTDDVWRKRFLLFMLVRLFGLIIFLLGIGIAYTNLIRPGGSPVVGGLLAILGAIDAAFAPRLLKKLWQQQDVEAGRPEDDPTQSR
jgi:hypothetical protein